MNRFEKAVIAKYGGAEGRQLLLRIREAKWIENYNQEHGWADSNRSVADKETEVKK